MEREIFMYWPLTPVVKDRPKGHLTPLLLQIGLWVSTVEQDAVASSTGDRETQGQEVSTKL